ncbi:MAG TPA: saccharopine dehydrogenase NADP-binding domain-containing protein [Emcibacteraceae bacterium]|nr:saccharopine dehydrogenase NADP-binding domain-containing protein [Emcibacteraceae bacterium]HRW29642.1 saccharopine dehydrogenase NADP-binding domain-containing protein [Emcibacteraceae bacterium]
MSAHKPSIHWIGAGLASGPGLVSLVNKWGEATVWDMVLDRANSLATKVNKGAKLNVRKLDLGDDASVATFRSALNEGDIIISMLPAAFHVQVGEIALEENCHLVTSSYISDGMRALDDAAAAKGLSFVNEVGLDPGIDHLLTHVLVDQARKEGQLGKGNRIDFVSYCGGFPAEETPFTYKFSWTPLGVLSALTNPAQLLKNGTETTIPTAWEAVSELSIHGEMFEAYANRNSLPFIAEYGLEDEKNLRNFVRGTLRMSGWKKAWKDIFAQLKNISSDDLRALSDKLWAEHQYADGEEDRVLLYVALTSVDEKDKEWHGSLTVDATGSGWQSAMANTVSYTVAEAVSALMEGRLAPGVQAAPHDVAEAKRWLHGLAKNGIVVKAVNVDL